jgi:hypothetical protein
MIIYTTLFNYLVCLGAPEVERMVNMVKDFLQINIHNFRITDVNTGSVVAIGHNYFYDWQTVTKTNAAVARINGDHDSLCDNDLWVDDPDIQDMIINEGGKKKEKEEDKDKKKDKEDEDEKKKERGAKS